MSMLLNELAELNVQHEQALDEGRYDDADEIERQIEQLRRQLKRTARDLVG